MTIINRYIFLVDASGKPLSGVKLEYDNTPIAVTNADGTTSTQPAPIPWYPPEYTVEGTLDVWNAQERSTYDATAKTWTTAALDPAIALSGAKSAKIAEFAAKRDAAILSDFQSDALAAGTMKTYSYDPVAQERFSKMLTRLTANTSIASVDWATKEDGLVTHTRAQFIQLATVDAYNHESTPAYHYLNLEAKVNACTTVAAVDAITW